MLKRDAEEDELGLIAERIRRLGFAILDSGFSLDEVEGLRASFDATRSRYIDRHGWRKLCDLDEHNTIRMPMAENPEPFRKLAFNERLLNLLGRLIEGQFILNQQNGVINPPKAEYNQGKWHRDLPYQHFVSTSPLAINALYCVDDFTLENGSTWVLPASHKSASFPTERYLAENALQVTAKSGQFIVLDCMVYHTGGYNATSLERRAVNHVYNIPYIKQQIPFSGNIDEVGLTGEQRRILGLGSNEPESVSAYLQGRG